MFHLPSNVLLNPAVERRVLRVRRHWTALLTVWLQTLWMVIGAVVLSRLASMQIDSAWLQSLLWYVSVGALIRLAWYMLQWWNDLFIVTDKRLIIQRGYIAVEHSMAPITSVTDITFSRPTLGMILSYGTLQIRLVPPNQDLEKIENVPMPEEVFLAISELIFGEKKQPRSHMLEPPRSYRHRRRRWSDS